MRLLLDTHFLIWLTLDATRLTATERAIIERHDMAIVCSAVSLWELRLKWHSFDIRGGRKGPIAPHDAMAVITERDWALLSLTPDHAVTRLETPMNHTDPFDELLLVQAQVEGLRLLTRDAKLRAHPLAYLVEPS